MRNLWTTSQIIGGGSASPLYHCTLPLVLGTFSPPKSYDENLIWRCCDGAKRPLGISCGSASMKNLFSSYFCFEKFSPGPKNDLERRVLRFSSICAKNQVLKLKIGKVRVIRVHANALTSYSPLSCSILNLVLLKVVVPRGTRVHELNLVLNLDLNLVLNLVHLLNI